MTDLARVWIMSADRPAPEAGRCLDVLDDGERARAAEILGERDRRQYTIAHGALRMLVAGELGVTPGELRWERGRYGKPTLATPWPGLSTSVSHSGELVAVAIARGRDVGVDIQRLAPRLDVVAMSARFYPSDEAAYVAAVGDDRVRTERFTGLWCRKEAVVKAAGGRLWPNLGIEVLGCEVVRCAEPAGAYRVADVPAPAGYRAAVALAGEAAFAARAEAWPGAVGSDFGSLGVVRGAMATQSTPVVSRCLAFEADEA